MSRLNINSLFAKADQQMVVEDILQSRHTHYWFPGGRGSRKSSVISLCIIIGMMNDAVNGITSHCVALRKVGNTIEDSVFAQFKWAIEMLGVSNEWEIRTHPCKLIHRTRKPDGTVRIQTILFRSSKNEDDEKRIKSIKFDEGYCKYAWFEELAEFTSMEEIRSINQSLMRGGDVYSFFYSYNPPKSVSSWVNAEELLLREDRLVYRSTYLDTPPEWLSRQFFIEAEELKKNNELAYRNEYLGEATGTGGAVFTNIEVRPITQDERKKFDNILDGIDFGYAVDPVCYLQMHFDKTRRTLYIFREIYKVGMSNRELADEIKKVKIGKGFITCDSAEPKSIDELRSLGLRTKPAKKGPDSIDYGIKYLQKLVKIVIDQKYCPNASREFSLYEYEKDKYGNFKSKYPDLNNHAIDCTRYAIEDYTISNTWELSRTKLY